MMNVIAHIAPEWKLGYLIAVMIGLFVSSHPAMNICLLLLQTALWYGASLGWRPFARVLKRLGLFFLVIGVSYAFVSVGGAHHWSRFEAGPWHISINVSGLYVALLMCLRVLTLVFASVWVQESGQPDDLVRALEMFRVPKFLAASINGTLRLASGGGGGMGGGRGGGRRQGARRRE